MPFTKTVSIELPEDLCKQVDEAAAADAMDWKTWLEQLIKKAVANHQQPEFSTDKHRVIRAFLRSVDAKRSVPNKELAAEAAVQPAVFVDIIKQYGEGITFGANPDDCTVTPAGLQRLRHALQQPGR